MIRTKPFSESDKLRLWEIEEDPLVSKKMPGKVKDKKELDEWLSENIVYGICDPQNNIIGFVQLYEVGESLLKRLPISDTKNLYEISFALPAKYRYTAGLVSQAVREVCALYPDFQIVAFADPKNEKSIRVLEHSGFSLVGKTKYHANEKIENLVYKKVDIRKAGGILLQNKKFLVVRQKNKDVFISPGGKLENLETPEEALVRELKEEIGVDITLSDLEKFGVFVAKAAGAEDKTIQMNVFVVKSWQGELTINKDDKVEEHRWIDSSDLGKIKLGSIFEHEVLPRLKQQNLID